MVLNYYDDRNTNASEHSFDPKIKAFKSQFRGAGDISFLFKRLIKLFA